jgi:hypothetical protein
MQLEDVVGQHKQQQPLARNVASVVGLHGTTSSKELSSKSNSLFPLSSSTTTTNAADNPHLQQQQQQQQRQRRLTRAAFSESLKRRNPGGQNTTCSVFDIKGIHKLQETFRILDSSVGKDFVSARHRNEEPEVCKYIKRKERNVYIYFVHYFRCVWLCSTQKESYKLTDKLTDSLTHPNLS